MSLILENWRLLLPGLWDTIVISVASLLASSLIGFVLGILCCMPISKWLLLPIRGLVEFLRAVPLIVNVYFVFFIAPQFGLTLSATLAAVVSLSLWGGANGTEIVRGGIEAVPRHQRRSARALGLREWEVFTLILLPQAARTILPSFAGLLTLLVQSTTLGALVGVPEFLQTNQLIIERTTVMDGQDPAFSIYAFVLVVYFLLCSLITWAARSWDKRMAAALGRPAGATARLAERTVAAPS